MTINIKLKVLIKFGVSEMMCEIESQKATKYVPFDVNVSIICEMLFPTCTEHTSTTSPVNERTIISIKTNILIKFGVSEICIELRAKKL